MLRYPDTFEQIITRALLVMMASLVLLATVELAWLPGKDVLTPPLALLGLDELPELFGLFLPVLIFIEHRVIHLEAVLVMALIAVTLNIVAMVPKEMPEGTLLGISAMALALTLGYHLVRHSRREEGILDPESKG